MARQAEHHLGCDENGVEHDADHEGAAEIRRCMAVVVTMLAMARAVTARVVVACMVMLDVGLHERDLLS